jgi:hypothetical protein
MAICSIEERFQNIFKFAFNDIFPLIGIEDDNKIVLSKFETDLFLNKMTLRKYELGTFKYVNAPFDKYNQRYLENTISKEDFYKDNSGRIIISCYLDDCYSSTDYLTQSKDAKFIKEKAYALADRFVEGLDYTPLFFNIYEEISPNEFIHYNKVIYLLLNSQGMNVQLEFNIFDNDIISDSFRKGIMLFIKDYSGLDIEYNLINEDNFDDIIIQFKSVLY